VAVWVVVVPLAAFVRLYLKAGRPWLAWTVWVSRTVALVLNFLVGQNLNYREITRLQQVRFLGEPAQIAEGVHNPWMVVGQLSLVAFVIFAADATVTVWRRGHRRTALTVGGSVVFFSLSGFGQSLLVMWGFARMPLTAGLSFMGVVLVMGYELSSDTLRAAQLARKLRESEAGLHEIEERMRLAVEGADFGIWIRDLARNEIWATDKWRALFGFPVNACFMGC
jgi:PAS domain-containing protein